MKIVTYIVSDIDKSIAFEWIAGRIDKNRIALSFILINSKNSYLKRYLEENNISVYLIDCKSKKSIPLAVWRCFYILKKIKPDVVHCHLFLANIIGLTAAKIAGVKSRIYTRHHSDYHHIYFPKAVKWDKYCNFLSTKIISISDCVSDILKQENVPDEKITKIWHGFDTSSFIKPDTVKVKTLNKKYNSNNAWPVIGVISRATYWKGIQHIIPAYQKFIQKYPNALLLLFNATGDYESEINALLNAIPEINYQKVYFENDITNLYHVFDMFIHVPISPTVEAFGQTYIECMLSGIPLVATKSGVANEILKDKINSLVVPFENSEAIYRAMIELLENENLRHELIKNATQTVEEKFSIQNMISVLEKLYLA